MLNTPDTEVSTKWAMLTKESREYVDWKLGNSQYEPCVILGVTGLKHGKIKAAFARVIDASGKIDSEPEIPLVEFNSSVLGRTLRFRFIPFGVFPVHFAPHTSGLVFVRHRLTDPEKFGDALDRVTRDVNTLLQDEFAPIPSWRSAVNGTR